MSSGADGTGDEPFHVLVVNDDEATCRTWDGWLSKNYRVSHVFSGGEAVQRTDDETDLLILERDLEDQTGDEVLDTLRTRGWDGQVIMITAVPPSLDRVWLEFDTYLVKPVERDALCQAVETQRLVHIHGDRMREYLRLLAMQQATHGPDEPSVTAQPEMRSPREIRERIERLEAELEPALASLDDDDLIGMAIRDLWYADPGDP